MSDPQTPGPGTIGWIDLTVDDAPELRNFYSAVVGWQSEPVSMGDYEDFNMMPTGDEPTAGICHARGGNAGLPAAWLIYIIVADLDASMEQVRQRGGEVVAGPKEMGAERYCVIRDPAGAHAALYQKA